ncbi:MAG: glutamyl-tRNA reductase [Verrucomicrobiota bacterium]
MPAAPTIHLLGISYHRAPAEVRESMTFNQHAIYQFLSLSRERFPGAEVVILSTCNRTEFYLTLGENSKISDWLALIREFRPHAPAIHETCYRYHYESGEAFNHLAKVASGLDSSVLGDSHILGQVKKAFAYASEQGACGKWLNELFKRTIRVVKKARAQTDIGYGAASVGSALAEMIAEQERLAKLGSSRILVIGAGSTARDIGRHLAKSKSRELIFMNRTWDRAVNLAQECGGCANVIEQLESVASDVDIIVTATSCPRPILRKEVLGKLVNHKHHLILFDASMPRNIESGSGLKVITIDSIRAKQSYALERRQHAVHEVERLIALSLVEWQKWLSCQPQEEAIKELYLSVDSFSEKLADRFLHTISEEETMYEIHKELKNFLHAHVRRLRELHFSSQG